MLSGVTIGMEGTPDVLEELQGLARAIGARPLVLTSEHKALYHAAAVVASNYLVTLARCAQMLLEQTGLTPEDAQTALLPIMDTTLHNVEHAGVTQALTGPIARNGYRDSNAPPGGAGGGCAILPAHLPHARAGNSHAGGCQRRP